MRALNGPMIFPKRRDWHERDVYGGRIQRARGHEVCLLGVQGNCINLSCDY